MFIVDISNSINIRSKGSPLKFGKAICESDNGNPTLKFVTMEITQEVVC